MRKPKIRKAELDLFKQQLIEGARKEGLMTTELGQEANPV